MTFKILIAAMATLVGKEEASDGENFIKKQTIRIFHGWMRVY